MDKDVHAALRMFEDLAAKNNLPAKLYVGAFACTTTLALQGRDLSTIGSRAYALLN